MSNYYVSYKQVVSWNGTVFNANEYRKAINDFYSKIDLVNPNLKTDQSASSVFDVPVRDLSPDARFPNEWSFDLNGNFSTTVRDELTGLFRVFLVLSGDVKVPRITSTGKTLRVIIAAANKSLISVGKTSEEAFLYAFKEARESLLRTLADQINLPGKGIKVENQDLFTDPDPALVGPPTQTISGVTNKAPMVDNPNIKLPTQEVKGLNANAAQQAASKTQYAASSVTSQVQGVADKTQSTIGKPDGLGKDWSPNKFSPESIAGNDKFVNAKTGMVESTSKLVKGLKGGLLGGALGAGVGAIAGGGKGALIGGLSGTALGAGLSVGGVTGGALAGGGLGAGIGGIVGGGKGALIGAVSGGAVGVAAAKLASIKKDMPKPNIPKPPSTPRIKIVKIPRPSNIKDV
jgi:hypothetical protein